MNTDQKIEGQLAAISQIFEGTKKMTKAIIKTFNETENAMDLTFAKNAAKVYAPFFKAVKDREIAFEMFKGEKGATEDEIDSLTVSGTTKCVEFNSK